MTSGQEEIFLRSDLLNMKKVAHDRRNACLHPSGSAEDARSGNILSEAWEGQLGAVNLAIVGSREGIQTHKYRGNHVRREFLPEELK